MNPIPKLTRYPQGEIFQDPWDMKVYLGIYFGAVVFFMGVFYFWKNLFENIL